LLGKKSSLISAETENAAKEHASRVWSFTGYLSSVQAFVALDIRGRNKTNVYAIAITAADFFAAVFCVGLVTEAKYGSTANDRSSKINVRYRT
jgi:hypothetical protein